MGRTVLAELDVRERLMEFAKESKFCLGLLLGQHSPDRDFVVHVAATPVPDEERAKLKGVQQFKDGWAAEHARQVTLLMPGGMCVLGIFIAGMSEPPHGSRVPQIIQAVHKSVNRNAYFYGSGGSNEKLLAYVNPHKEVVTCKSIDASSSSSSFRPADIKFQASPTIWQHLHTTYHVDSALPLMAERWQLPLKKHLQATLSALSNLLDHACYVMDGQLRSEFEPLSPEASKKKQRHGDADDDDCESHAVDILTLAEAPDGWDVATQGARLIFKGAMHSIAYVNGKATVQDAIDAIKQDILRSMAARLEMHCDSLLDDEQSATTHDSRVVHEPPRRVLVPLPAAPVMVGDYLFPGEGPQEALPSMVELLGLKLTQGDIVDDVELQGEHDEAKTGSETEMLVDTLTDTQLIPSRGKTCNLSAALLATAIAIAGVGISYVTLTMGSKPL